GERMVRVQSAGRDGVERLVRLEPGAREEIVLPPFDPEKWAALERASREAREAASAPPPATRGLPDPHGFRGAPGPPPPPRPGPAAAGGGRDRRPPRARRPHGGRTARRRASRGRRGCEGARAGRGDRRAGGEGGPALRGEPSRRERRHRRGR